MESRIIRTTEEFIGLQNDWERLEKDSPWVSYFSTYRYSIDWWKAFEKDPNIELLIIIILHNFSVVGIAPLQIVKKKLYHSSFQELQFLHGGGDYSNFLIDHNTSADSAKIVNEIINLITELHTEYDRINLTHICQYTLLSHQLLISKHNANLKYLIECPYIDFSKYSDFIDYTKVFIPKKTKQYINRFKREVDFRMVVTNENMVEEMGKIHIAEKNYLQNKGMIWRHSFFETPKELDFRKSLYEHNNHVLTYMLVDNKTSAIICYYTGYVKGTVFHSVTTAYNPQYADLAVGKIFNYMIFEENFNNPRWVIFDMGTGRYFWKFEMTNTFNLLYQWDVDCMRSKWKTYLRKISRLHSLLSHQ